MPISRAAEQHLRRVDPVMRRLIREIGPLTLLPKVGRSPFESLARAIAYQQRNGFRIAYGLRQVPAPKEVLRYGKRWKPHRTAAAWYLWRAADSAKQAGEVL